MKLPKDPSYLLGIKALLKIAGFSQNGRNRIMRLTGDEISILCKSCPEDEQLWRPYVNEIQILLSKMDQARKLDSMGRPYVTAALASVVRKLAHLQFLYERGFSFVQASKMRDLLKYDDWCKSLGRLIGIGKLAKNQNSESILIESAIQLMGLYRDELIAPPRLKCRRNFDEFTLHEIENGDFNWMDDGGKSYLEDIRDIPLVTHYDELPHFASVLDWFTDTKPVFDKNQIKQGWAYLERLSLGWHQGDESFGSYEELISECPSWNCAISDHQVEWLSAVPLGNPYLLVPLTTPQQLLEESTSMQHCVVTYIEDCVGGHSRIFSVRDIGNNQRIATVELSFRSGLWVLGQLKGRRNEELIHRSIIADDPLATMIEALLNWYNAKRPNSFL